MLPPRQAFKVAFLLECAAAGLTVAETGAAIAALEKAAADESSNWIETAKNLPWWTIRTLVGGGAGLRVGGSPGAVAGAYIANNPGQAAMLGLGGAALVGGAGGGLLAQLRAGRVDPEEVRKQELIGGYESFADDVRRRDAERRRGPARGRVTVPFA